MMNYREPCGNIKEKTGNISHVHGHERFDIKNDELWETMWGTYKRKKKKKNREDFTHLNGNDNFENNDELLGTKWEHTIMASCFFILNVKEFKLKIHLIKF